jgi:hypothetical protein
VPKKSWQNTLTSKESVVADQLYEKVLDLKNAEGLMMCGTEVVSVFLKRRVQPLMSRPHQLWMYTGASDKSRINSTDVSEEVLRDEVRRLTRLSQKDNIVMTSARPPLGLKHLPAKEILLVFASDIISLFLNRNLITFSIDRLPPLLNVILLHPKVG